MRLFIAALVAVVTLSSFSLAEVSHFGKWERLGVKAVDRKVDHDVVKVGVKDGVFTSLKLKVRRSDINLHKVVVHFKDGTKQVVKARQVIRQGQMSRTLDLKGNKRFITHVSFWYDTKGLQNKAVIELWGKH